MPTGARIIDERWALPATFRAGGHARVYRASDLNGEIEGPVAVKVIPPAIKGDERLAILVFNREHEALSRLQHPNIVELLDAGRDQESGERYFVFPWLERDLDALLLERPTEGWDDFWARVGEEVLDALAYAHGRDVIHRDIKPANVLVDGDDHPRISDFGIAKVLTQIAPGATVREQVSRPYAPPEYDDGRHSPSRDVHAFGVLCLTALTAVDPTAGYEGDPYQAVRDALDLLDVPEAIAGLLAACVDGDPERRPVNAVALLERIREVENARQETLSTLVEQRPICFLRATAKATSAIMDHLDFHTELQVEAAIVDNLADEAALLPFPTKAFDDGSPTDDHFYLVGTELRLHVVIDRDARDRLVVLNAWPGESSLLERERDRGWSVPCGFAVGLPPDPVSAQDLIRQIEAGVFEHQADERLRLIRGHRDRPLRIWRATLAALRSIDREREAPLRYVDVSETQSGLRFQLEVDASEDLVGDLRLVDLADGRSFVGEVVAVGDDTLTLRPTAGNPEELPTRGVLRIDLRAARAARRRQEQALDALQYGRALRPELRDLLLEPAHAKEPSPVEPVRWRQANIDDPKRLAIAAALGTEDLLLVEGPPGTGKTTFITELILQYLERNPDHRILISSQTNAALDNVLERLAIQEPALRLLRVARPDDDRVASGVEPYRLDRQIEAWRAQVVSDGRAWLAGWASDRGISSSQVEVAMRLDELAAEREALERLGKERLDVERRLSSTRAEPDAVGVEEGDLEAILAERQADIIEESAAARVAAADAAKRLVELRVARRAADLNDVSPADLRRRARETLPTEGTAVEECRRLIDLLGEWHGLFGRGPQFHAAALLRSQVVAATCIGYAGVRGSDTIEFDLCIIDEASKATATELLVPMTRARRWVLVGDHRQLPPFIDEALERPDVLQDHQLRVEDVRETLFDRLRGELPRASVSTLTRQHRMVPPIGDLISTCFYDGGLESAPRDPLAFLSVALGKPVSWQSTAKSNERFERRAGTTLTNRYEARCIEKILARLEFAAKGARRRRKLTVAVLSGYAGQRDLIERQLADELRVWTHLSVTCSTIDAFQGREADVAIYSVTRSNRDATIGFLRERRRLNVALSRGREALILVGDHVGVAAARGENPFIAVLDYIADHSEDCALEDIQP